MQNNRLVGIALYAYGKCRFAIRLNPGESRSEMISDFVSALPIFAQEFSRFLQNYSKDNLVVKPVEQEPRQFVGTMKGAASLLADQLEDVRKNKTGHSVSEMILEILDYFEYFEWNDQVAMACCGAFTFDLDKVCWD